MIKLNDLDIHAMNKAALTLEFGQRLYEMALKKKDPEERCRLLTISFQSILTSKKWMELA